MYIQSSYTIKNMLSTGLKIHTKVNHQKLEKKIIAAINAIDNTQGYADLLILFASYFGAVEKLVDVSINLSCVPDYMKRRKVSALKADMDFLNTPLSSHATPILLPDIENNLQCLGAMYVMEGSKLGGKVISKHIQQTLAFSESCGAKFVSNYGVNTVALWKIFLSKFSEYVVENDCEEEAIRGANGAFTSIYDYFESNLFLIKEI